MDVFFTSVNLIHLSTYLCTHELLTADEMNILHGNDTPLEKAGKIFSKLKQKGKETPQKLLCCLTKEQEHSGHQDIAKKLASVMRVYDVQPYCPICQLNVRSYITKNNFIYRCI